MGFFLDINNFINNRSDKMISWKIITNKPWPIISLKFNSELWIEYIIKRIYCKNNALIILNIIQVFGI